jgi:type I restriction enzyme S subunit
MARYKFDQIAFNSTDKKKPVDEDKEHYIGLEHLDSGSLKVTRWGSEIAPKGEKLLMKKGDVLFGKRRAYQKKVAIAPFDGIFSAHGMVLRPRRDVIDAEFFPLFIASDYFLDAAIKISVGSLSPTINWRDLKELEFDIPSLSVQKKLAKVLWAINDTKGAYEQLIQETDELVKSQFIEMFGNKGYSFCRLSDQCELITKGTTPTTIGYDFTDIGVNFIKIENITEESKFNTDEMMHINDECNIVMKRSQLKEGDILFSIAGAIGRCALVTKDILPANINQALAIIRLKKDAQFSRDFLLATLKSGFIEKQYLKLKRGVAQLNLSLKDVGNFKIPEPPEQEQKKFVELNRQSDKSKFELQYVNRNVKEMITCSQKKIRLNR